jgi:hypothetical protein
MEKGKQPRGGRIGRPDFVTNSGLLSVARLWKRKRASVLS